MAYQFPFGQTLQRVEQQDKTPKKVFVLGVYASAVHACWKKDGKVICKAIAVASEPKIFWDGNMAEAKEIISKIDIPKELGTLEPAESRFNGPSAKVLGENILAHLVDTREDAWLCDLLPETRLNPNQIKVINDRYSPMVKQYGLNEVNIPKRPNTFCDQKRCEEILEELKESQANLLVLLGDIPIKQFLKKVTDIKYSSLQDYVNLFGYGNSSEITIGKRTINVLPLAHPRQIGELGVHSDKWSEEHSKWEQSIKKKR